jgi:capsular polysaccharide biosynthesis protein
MAGAFFGLAIPLMYEFVNRRIRSRDDFERDSGVPVLAEFGAIPLKRGLA